MKHKNVLVAGTFDRLHKGHKLLLDNAVNNCSENLFIGITKDEMCKNKKYSEIIQSENERYNNLQNYFTNNNNKNININIFFIEDKYSISITNKELNAIVLTDENYNVGLEINNIRINTTLNPLELIVIQRTELSSTYLREKELSKNLNSMMTDH